MSTGGGRRVAVVTGASSGIGAAALPRARAARGWHVVGLSRAPAPDADEHELCDVADRADVERVAAAASCERHPQIDLLVNNAGIAARGSFIDVDPERIERVSGGQLPRLGLVPARVLPGLRPRRRASSTSSRSPAPWRATGRTGRRSTRSSRSRASIAVELGAPRDRCPDALCRASSRPPGFRSGSASAGCSEAGGGSAVRGRPDPRRARTRPARDLRAGLVPASRLGRCSVPRDRRPRAREHPPRAPGAVATASASARTSRSPPHTAPARARAPVRAARPSQPARSRYDSRSRGSRSNSDRAQHEPVGVEERAQVGVGEHARRRRVARDLEPVQLERGERIDRRELVDDEHRAARASHAHELCDHELRPVDVVQRAERRRDVERAVVERELLRVGLDELDVRRGVCARARSSIAGVRVDGDDLAHERRERERERARAGAGVERALVAARAARSRSSRAASAPARCAWSAANRSALRRSCADHDPPRAPRVASRSRTRARSDRARRRVRAPRAARPAPTIVTGVPRGSSRSSSTANASIETVPTTRRALAVDDAPRCRSGRAGSRRRSRPGRCRSTSSRVGDEARARSPVDSPARSSFDARELARPREHRLEPVGRRVRRRTATGRRARSRSAPRRSAPRAAAAPRRCSRRGASGARTGAVASRNRSICTRAKSGSLSAVARCVISPTTSRAGRRRAPRRPTAPCRCRASRARAHPRASSSRDHQLERRLARRARRRSAAVGPHHEDPRVRELAPQLERLGRRSRRRARTRPPRARRRAQSTRAVPVAVGLHDRPQLGAAERREQRAHVPPQRAEVDRRSRSAPCLRSTERRPAASPRRRARAGAPAAGRRRRARAASAASARRGRARPPPPPRRGAAPSPSRGTRRRRRSGRRRFPRSRATAGRTARRGRPRRGAATSVSGALQEHDAAEPRRRAAHRVEPVRVDLARVDPEQPRELARVRRQDRRRAPLERLELPERVGVDDDRQRRAARAGSRTRSRVPSLRPRPGPERDGVRALRRLEHAVGGARQQARPPESSGSGRLTASSSRASSTGSADSGAATAT